MGWCAIRADLVCNRSEAEMDRSKATCPVGVPEGIKYAWTGYHSFWSIDARRLSAHTPAEHVAVAPVQNARVGIEPSEVKQDLDEELPPTGLTQAWTQSHRSKFT